MLPGPIIVKRRSECGGLLKQRTISSGNTRRAKVWTDGEMLAPMLPITPPLIRCGHCDSIIWSQDLKKVDSYETYIRYRALSDDKDEYKFHKKELGKNCRFMNRFLIMRNLLLKNYFNI